MILPLLLAALVFTGTTDGAPIASAPTHCNRGTPPSPEALTPWRAEATGIATATTCPETVFDSLVTVNGVSGEAACNDDADSSHNCSTVSWAVTAGSVWAIGVSGYNGRAGEYTLHVQGPVACSSTGYSSTPTLRWESGSVCPCTLAQCSKAEGYRVTWATSAAGPWHELVKLPCAPAYTDEDGVHARWCWGIDKDAPVSRWMPSTVAGSEILFRVEAISATGKVSCAATTMPSVCWPSIQELFP